MSLSSGLASHAKAFNLLRSNVQVRRLATIPFLINGLLLCSSVASAQAPIDTGFFSTEIVAATGNGSTYVLMNELMSAVPIDSGQPTYLDLPLAVTSASLNGNGFASHLYRLDEKRRVSWNRQVGVSSLSSPGGLLVDSLGHAYVGGYTEGEGLRLYKFGSDGTTIFSTPIDTGGIVKGLFLFNDTVTLLVAVNESGFVEVEGGQLEFHQRDWFETVRVHRGTGAVIDRKKNPNMTVLSMNGFQRDASMHPWFHVLYKEDSIGLVFGWQERVVTWAIPELQGEKIQASAGNVNGFYFIASTDTLGMYSVYNQKGWFRKNDSISYRRISHDGQGGRTQAFLSRDGELRIAFLGLRHVEVGEYDRSRPTLTTRRFDMQPSQSDHVSTLIENAAGGYDILYVKAVKKKNRVVSIMSIDRYGKLVRD